MIPVIFINCKSAPFLDDIMCYLKQYETRTRNTLGGFLGMRVLLAETGHGRPLVKCFATIGEILKCTTKDAWDDMLEYTRVPVGSKYDWKRGKTKVKWLYYLKDIQPLAEPFRLPCSSIRHGYVWAEYEWGSAL